MVVEEDAVTGRSLVLVHGVGAERAGDFLNSYLVPLEQVPVAEAGIITAPHEKNPWEYVAEVFWGDATGLRIRSFPMLLAPLVMIGFVLRFLLALSQVASNGWDHCRSPASRPSLPAAALKYFLFAVAIPSGVVFTLPLFHALVPGFVRLVLMIGVCLPPVLALAYLWGKDLACRIGLCLTAVLIPVMFFGLALVEGDIAFWAKFSARCVGFLQISAFVLTVAALLEILARAVGAKRDRPMTGSARFTTRAHPYLLKVFAVTFPFAIIGGGFGSLGWAVNLWSAQRHGATPGDFKDWSSAYQEWIPYDLALMEAVFAVAMLAIGVLLSFLLIRYFVALFVYSNWLARKPPLGAWFRRGLSRFLFAYLIVAIGFFGLFAVSLPPLAVTVPGAEGFRDWFFGIAIWLGETMGLEIPQGTGADTGTNSDKDKYDVLLIYSASASRIVGFLPTLAPGAIVFIATAADVLFWLVKAGYGATAGIAQTCRERFVATMDKIVESGGKVTCVVGYSQGSVVAIDALEGRDGMAKIITIGSPIASLYSEFLGIDLGKGSDLEGRWINFCRSSDYIGGPIPWARGSTDQVTDEHFGSNHLNYFSESTVMKAVRGAGSG